MTQDDEECLNCKYYEVEFEYKPFCSFECYDEFMKKTKNAKVLYWCKEKKMYLEYEQIKSNNENKGNKIK